ncbi:MAG: carbamoyltransferase N-terminal domain-containing protein [Pseudolabrys sp.]
MIILGLNVFHADSSACVVRDGKLIAAVEEERLRRIKHWAGFPAESIRYCLKEAGVTLSDVDAIAINQNSGANFLRKVAYIATKRPHVSLIIDRIRNRNARLGIPELLAQHFSGNSFRGSLINVEHHRAHLSSAFHVSPFENATVVSVDGFGDFASAAWGIGRGTTIDIEGRVYFPHSLGIFYQALTQFLGFPHYGDEYKVMGLAPYGKPAFLTEMRQIARLRGDGGFELDLNYFRHHKEGVSYTWTEGIPEVGRIFSPALAELLGPARSPDEPITPRHQDLACSIQAMYEEAFFNLLDVLQARHGQTAISIAGGCGMNSVANGKIRRRTKYERVYVQSAAGDAGGAIGAAFSVWHEMGGKRDFVMDHAYWGPSYGQNEIDELLQARAQDLSAACTIETIDDEDDLCMRVAASMAKGEVVGWFQGRLEWGPRALGNRSIVCDPRRADMKNILNAKIKRRESFRPFAPSVKQEAVTEWFEEDDNVPFMMQVYQVREAKRAQIPRRHPC